MNKKHKIICAAVLIILVIAIIVYVVKLQPSDTDDLNDNPNQSEDIGESLEYETLPYGYSYDSEGNIVDYENNIVENPGTLFIHNDEPEVKTTENDWITLTGDNVHADEVGIATYGKIDGETGELIPYEDTGDTGEPGDAGDTGIIKKAGKYGYEVYGTSEIKIYLNNFIKDTENQQGNSGKFIVYVSPQTEKGYNIELTGLSVNNTEVDITSTSYVQYDGGYITFPWLVGVGIDSKLNAITSFEFGLKLTSDDGKTIETGKLDIVDNINNILRLIKSNINESDIANLDIDTVDEEDNEVTVKEEDNTVKETPENANENGNG